MISVISVYQFLKIVGISVPNFRIGNLLVTDNGKLSLGDSYLWFKTLCYLPYDKLR